MRFEKWQALGNDYARIERGHVAYVKRQLTWMKKLAGVEVMDRTGLTATEAAALLHGRLPVVRSR